MYGATLKICYHSSPQAMYTLHIITTDMKENFNVYYN